MILTLFRKLRAFSSTEVPADIAACEFDCREVDCSTERFLTCPKRMKKRAAVR